MNDNEIRNKCAEILKMTSFYSDEYFPKLNAAFEREISDMRLNFEFFSDKARVFCYERGHLVCEWQADETQVIFLIVESVLYHIITGIVISDENLIKCANRNHIDINLKKSLTDKAFDEISGVYNELYRQDFGLFKLKYWDDSYD